MGNVFLGLPVPLDIGETLLTQIFRQSPQLLEHTRLRWTTPAHQHLTLHFFGPIALSQLSIFIEDLENPLKNFKKISIKINKIAGFPDVNSRILAAIGELSMPLAELYHCIQKEVIAHEFPVEQRPYLPHITLSRSRQRNMFKEITCYLNDFYLPISQLILYQTQATEEGSQYLPIHTWDLQSNNRSSR